jgi:hypothetical protein
MVGADDPPIVDLPPPPVDGMPPLVLHKILSKVVAWQSPTPSPPEFRFEWSPSAARHNLLVLRKYHMDLDAAIRAQPFSTLTPGSEFRPVTVLEPLCGGHPLWPRIRQYLTTAPSAHYYPSPKSITYVTSA